MPTYPLYPSEPGTHGGVQPPSPQPQPGTQQPFPMPQQPGTGPQQPDFGPQQPGTDIPQQPGTNIPQQPPSGGQIPQYPIAGQPQFIIVPYPISGVPSNCPCYYMQSQNNTTTAPQGTQPPQATAQPAPAQQPPQGQQFTGGYFPAGLFLHPFIFFPSCGGNGQQVQQQVQQMFTGAVPVPYACDACAQQQAQQQQQAQNNQRAQQVRRRGVNRRRRISAGSK